MIPMTTISVPLSTKMTKDRLGDFQRIAKMVPVDRNSEVELGGKNESLALSDFLLQTEDIRHSIGIVDSTVAEIRRIHAEILSSPAGGNDLRCALEKTTESFKLSVNEAKTKLQFLEAELTDSQISSKSPTFSLQLKGRRRSMDSEESASASDRIKRTQFLTLVQRLCAALQAYSDAQTTYREGWKHRIQRQLRIAGRSVDNDVLEDMIETEDTSIFTQGVITSTQQAKLAHEAAEARRWKYADALKLRMSNAAKLLDLMAELEKMASGQGKMEDNTVETHVIEAKQRVAEGAQQPREALKRKRNALKKKLILGGIIAGLMIIVTVVITALLV